MSDNLDFNNKLFGLDSHFNNLVNLYNSDKFPKVTLLSGQKGMGKYTIISHFLTYVFDKDNYGINNKEIDQNSIFISQLINSLCQNIITLKKNTTVKIDDIRLLKKKLLSQPLNNKPRFIILDDVELYNINSLNALLKILEEPSKNNYFILINNQQNNLLDTIHSRSIETKVYLKNSERIEIINLLIKQNQIEPIIEYINTNISPGTFLLYNNICLDNDIGINSNFITKIQILLKLYKKSKNIVFIKSSIFFTEQYFYKISLIKKDNLDMLINVKKDIIKNLNDLVTYNLNLNLVLNSISTHFNYAKE